MAGLKPVYLIHGDDEVKLDAWKVRVKARAKAEQDSATIDLLTGDRLTIDALIEAMQAMTLSMGTRYLLADGIQAFKPTEMKQLVAALPGLPADAILVLIARGKVTKGKGPANAKLIEAVEERGGEVHLCAAPANAALPAWLAQRAGELGVSISRDASLLLVERVGSRQQRLMRELEKLSSFVADGGTIDAADVEAVSAMDIDARAYQLGDAIVECDGGRALAVAEELKADGEDMMAIVFALLRKLRDTRSAWAMVEAGRPPAEIQAELKCPPWLARKLVAEARKADGEQLELAIGLLADLDYAVRGGSDRDTWTELTLALRQMTGAQVAGVA